MTVDVHVVVEQRLRAVDQRYTVGRRELVARLRAADGPVTITDLLESGDRLPQSSVYRNLAVLEQAGVLHRIVASGDFARFELAEDLTEHPPHLICAQCGSVEDFPAPASLERKLGRAVATIEAEHDFAADRHRLDLIGLCAECR